MRFVLVVGLIACGAAKPIAKVTNLGAPADELVAAVFDDRVAPQIAAEITASLVARPRGEIERALRDRDFGAVLIHRIETSGNDLEARGWFAHSLSLWEPERGDPILARETRRALTPGSYASEGVVLMTERRIERKDPDALPDYAAWLVTLPPTKHSIEELFSIVADHHTHPKITMATKGVFRVGSPWLAVDDEFAERMLTLLRGKAISIPAFNLSIENALADLAPIGRLTTIDEPPPPRTSKLAEGYSDRGFVLDLGRSDLWSMKRSTARIHGIAIGKTDVRESQLRVADFYAWILAGNEGAPEFNPTWPIARRDAAIEKVKRWVVMQNGAPWQAPPEKRHLIF